MKKNRLDIIFSIKGQPAREDPLARVCEKKRFFSLGAVLKIMRFISAGTMRLKRKGRERKRSRGGGRPAHYPRANSTQLQFTKKAFFSGSMGKLLRKCPLKQRRHCSLTISCHCQIRQTNEQKDVIDRGE